MLGTMGPFRFDLQVEKTQRSRKILAALFRPVSFINSQSNFRQLFAKMSGVPFRTAVSPILKYFVSGRSSSEVG